MAQYDEFGRPIYETAEEYNKAKKTGSNSRTYDSPEGNAYKHNPIKINKRYEQKTTQYGKKASVGRPKVVVLGMIFLIMAFCMGFVLSAFNVVRNSYDQVYDIIEDELIAIEEDDADSYDEYSGDSTLPLPEGFQIFSYDGEMYTLPTTFEEISKMGFTLEEAYEESDMIETDYEEMLILNGDDGYMAAMIRISNYSEEELMLGECLVDYFYIDNPAAYDESESTTDFVFADGFTFESTYEDLENYFGTSTYHYHEDYDDGSYFDSYDWYYYGDDEIQYVNVTFWNDKIANVSIEKKLYEYKY